MNEPQKPFAVGPNRNGFEEQSIDAQTTGNATRDFR